MRKHLIFACITLSLMITNVFPTPQKVICNKSTVISESKTHIVPLAEETTWYYRSVNGKLQKRLWSRTYNKWLTDWIWV